MGRVRGTVAAVEQHHIEVVYAQLPRFVNNLSLFYSITHHLGSKSVRFRRSEFASRHFDTLHMLPRACCGRNAMKILFQPLLVLLLG